jgi:ankyrin repeat protein
LLLANGANVDALSNNGVTPLHWAVAKGRKDVAELLREHGGHDIGSNFFDSDWNYP